MATHADFHITRVAHHWRERALKAEAELREERDGLATIAAGLERDRREPDKVLTYVQALRREATDIDIELSNAEEASE